MPNPPSRTDALPPDVVIARAMRAHTRTLLAMCGMVLVLTLVGTTALQMAGPDWTDRRVQAGLSMLAGGQLLAIVAAVLAGLGWARLVRGVGTPGTAEGTAAVAAGLPGQQVERTARQLALVLRATIATAILGIAIWAVADASGLIGAAVGAVLMIQVAVVIALVRVNVLLRPRRP